MSVSVRFWGVRGSIACPEPSHTHFGGNTSCVEFRVDKERIILDSGTGIRRLGLALLRKKVARATLLLSHTHWDHIDGFPFFAPLYDKSFQLLVKAGHLSQLEGGLQSVIDKQMSNPYFPVPIQALSATLTIEDFKSGESFSPLPGVVVRTLPLPHPGGATAYRLEAQGRSLCYITDTEHVPGRPYHELIRFLENADLVVYDSTYTDEEFTGKRGWGHSTWQEGIRLCQWAGVERLALFHHDPAHDDDCMRKIDRKARRLWKKAFVAREGMRIRL